MTPPHPPPGDALGRWRRAHHAFFVLIQALILTHRGVERALEAGDTHRATEGLRQSADLLWAATAAMRLAGDMSPEAYAEVRRSMEPPAVPPSFSGLYSADHIVMLQALKRMKPLLEHPPHALEPALRAYRRAADAAYQSHAWVCQQFVGDAPSLKMQATATEDASAPERLLHHFRRRYLDLTGHPEKPPPLETPHMAIPRVLEPEVMDTEEEARDYDAMDHAAVNARFCEDLLALSPGLAPTLDVGTGTALIPITLCRRAPSARVVAIDLADWMLRLATANVRREGLEGAISVERADAKALPYPDASFACVVSNTILHHLPDAAPALAEMRRVLRPGGWLFVRDLLRPASDAETHALVRAHAADASPHQRALFDASLRASFTLEDARALARGLGAPAEAVRQTSDRHWTLAYKLTEG
jgi:ubiquinone/menaquinone biosynthesis C-methylase UbiE